MYTLYSIYLCTAVQKTFCRVLRNKFDKFNDLLTIKTPKKKSSSKKIGLYLRQVFNRVYKLDMVWGSGPQTDKHLPQSFFFRSIFFIWRHFSLLSMNHIFLRINPTRIRPVLHFDWSGALHFYDNLLKGTVSGDGFFTILSCVGKNRDLIFCLL